MAPVPNITVAEFNSQHPAWRLTYTVLKDCTDKLTNEVCVLVKTTFTKNGEEMGFQRSYPSGISELTLESLIIDEVVQAYL